MSKVTFALTLAAFGCCAAWSQTTNPTSVLSEPNGNQAAQQPSNGSNATADQSQTPPSTTPASTVPANTAAAQAPAAAPATAPAGESLTWHKIDFFGMVDAYGSWNDNHPGSGFNDLYNLDDKTNQVNLNMLKLTASHDPDPVGFRIDIGLGRAFDIMHTPKPSPEFFDYVEQAYISLKPKAWKGFEADFGDFVTSAGAEVIESKDNWNYSRSLLFALAIPYYHFGVRTSLPLGSSFTVGVQEVNGWNQVVDQHGNNMKTTGITSAFTRKKFTLSNNYYVGPQWTGSNNRNRNLFDSTLLLTPNDKFNAYLNYDYGEQAEALASHQHWTGFAAAAHWQVTKHIGLSPRAEYYNDATGFTTGKRQDLHEVTITGEYRIIDNLLTRLEYRHDASDIPFFERGSQNALAKSQSTITVGLIAFYPAKHQ